MRDFVATAKKLRLQMIDESKISDSASIYMLTWAAIFNKYQPHKHVRRLQLRTERSGFMSTYKKFKKFANNRQGSKAKPLGAGKIPQPDIDKFVLC